MHRRVILLLLILVCDLTIHSHFVGLAGAQTGLECDQYLGWIEAQTALEVEPETYAPVVDPDNNGVACDDLWGTPGFAGVTWTDEIPSSAFEAELVSIVDGDTFDIVVNGVFDRLRLYRADTPETYENPQCGGNEATEQVTKLLAMNDRGATIWIEQDNTERDQYGRLLGYVWLYVDGWPMQANEAMIRSGWAADVNYGDNLYDTQLLAAADFAQRWQIGLYQTCPGGPNPPDQPPAAPTPGLFDPPAPTSTDEYQGDCDSSYPNVCIPPEWVYGDLNCENVRSRRFQVLPPDPHGFDRDGNGVGCENYDEPYVGLPR